MDLDPQIHHERRYHGRQHGLPGSHENNERENNGHSLPVHVGHENPSIERLSVPQQQPLDLFPEEADRIKASRSPMPIQPEKLILSRKGFPATAF